MIAEKTYVVYSKAAYVLYVYVLARILNTLQSSYNICTTHYKKLLNLYNLDLRNLDNKLPQKTAYSPYPKASVVAGID